MKILIIGASGLVGKACYEFLYNKFSNNVVGTYQTYKVNNLVYFNIFDSKSIEILYKNWDVIIHTGALTNVDLCEIDEDLSFQQTVLATAEIIRILNVRNKNAKLIYLSTDYVFDGDDGPYAEISLPNPINVYGRHKLLAEKSSLNFNEKTTIVRVTSVYGNELRNKNFISRLLLKYNEPINISLPYDQFSTPVSSYDIAKVISLIIEKDFNGIINVAGTDYLNRFQIFQKVQEYFPNKFLIPLLISTNELNQKAKRPLKGGLKSNNIYQLKYDFEYINIDYYLKNIYKYGI